jgi:predicted RecB family nuclease
MVILRKKGSGSVVYSPSDLIRYFASPFASWMDRHYLENPNGITPDEATEDQKLVAQTGDQHETSVLTELKAGTPELVEIPKADFADARSETLGAIRAKVPIIFQAALDGGQFAGFADFLILDGSGRYQVWDTKLALTPKPYFAIQLCCYAEMLAAVTGEPMSEKCGIILGRKDRVEFRVEDFIHYYRRLKRSFLAMQEGYTSDMADRPEPMPRAEQGRWSSLAEIFFAKTDHLVQVAGISVGQIKKLKAAGIDTVAALAAGSGKTIAKLANDSLEKLVGQAELQCGTQEDRNKDPDAGPRYAILPHTGANGEPIGLALLPPGHPADVYFDMEGYPLTPGGLEYLFGVYGFNGQTGSLEFNDWWAHDRVEEKRAFEGFMDWVFARWKGNPGMHIFHYAAYEVSAVRRLSTFHDTRQEEVDDLLRNEVFVDLYKIVRGGLRIGENSYSLKTVENLYRTKRATAVATAAQSMVQYARWMESGQSRNWNTSNILRGIREYNEDDCKSTADLTNWLRLIASKAGITFATSTIPSIPSIPKVLSPAVIAGQGTGAALRLQTDPVSVVLADLVEFHWREQKPMWWRMYDRAKASSDELVDDPGCIQGVYGVGVPIIEKQSLVQTYQFDPTQACKVELDDTVMFTHDLNTKFTATVVDLSYGELKLKIGQKGLLAKCGGAFPKSGSLIKDEYVSPGDIPMALCEVASGQLSDVLHAPAAALLKRVPPATPLQNAGESPLDAAVRMTTSMSGGSLIIQGPPGTGKTFTAAGVITALLAAGKRVGITSNSHKAIMNLLGVCSEAASQCGLTLRGIEVGGDAADALFAANPNLARIECSKDARVAYTTGVAAGTAWLFARPEWKYVLDFLFIDEAGQVPLANAVAISRCAKSLILLGDQMQLEQPVQGSHPGDAGLSVLQYALKDTAASQPDLPVFHAVVPPDVGLFLGESRRMHPDVCRFISESIYEGRLGSDTNCARQKIALSPGANTFVKKESGILFSGVQHDANVQQSDEEVERVKAIYDEMRGRLYTAKDLSVRPLGLNDFLFIAPYNAQVRALQKVLPLEHGSGVSIDSRDWRLRSASSPSAPATANTVPAASPSSSTATG